MTGLADKKRVLLVLAGLLFIPLVAGKSLAGDAARREQASTELANLAPLQPLAVESLLKLGADPNYAPDGQMSAIESAAFQGKTDILTLFAKWHANFNVVDRDGYTPLKYAVKANNLPALELLLKLGAKVNYRPGSGADLLTLAAGGEDETRPDFGIAKILIEHGASVNERGRGGATGLMIAVRNNHDPLVRFLLRSGVNLEVRDDNGFTALAVAADRNLPKMIELLSGAGANLESQNNLSETPLTLAGRVGALDAARMLIHLGAKIDPNVTTIALSQIKDNKFRLDPYPWVEGPADLSTHIRATIKYLIDNGAPKPPAELAKYLEMKQSKHPNG